MLAGVLFLALLQDPVTARVQAARAAAAEAFAQNQPERARHEWRSVLRFLPADLDALQGLLALAERGSADARLRALLSYELAGAAANGAPPKAPKLAPSPASKEAEKQVLGLPRELAGAAHAILRGAERYTGADDAGIAAWHAALVREIAAGYPQLQAELEPDLAALLARCAPDPVQVVHDLAAEIDDAASEARATDLAEPAAGVETGYSNPERARSAGQAVLLARSLTGLAAQAREAKGKGVPAGFDAAVADAGPALGAAGSLRARLGHEIALDALAANDRLERALANPEFESWSMPAITHSPRGWYRVETTCGLSALEGTALSVEKHHQRIANWVGKDPFVGRPGLVRIVPRGSDLDAEGAPHWWAGGFQGGDVTTFRCAMTSREGLGHGLTHELTHRFDGALWANCPGWLMEGRACWTGAAYDTEDDTQFIADYLPAGTFAGTFNLGYGDPGKLRTLIDGSLEEYRDNYTAGTALWSYLYQAKDSDYTPKEEEKDKFHPTGVYLYRERMRPFMEGAPQGGAVAWFERWLADGQGGRPRGIDEFTARFRDFMSAFLQKEPPAWTRRFAGNGSGPSNDLVFPDRATWPNDHWRCPPSFGEEHAGAAGMVLAERGRDAAAIRALEWGRSVDEPDRPRLDTLAQCYARNGDTAGAFVTRAEIRRLQGGAPPARTGVPASLGGTLERAGALVAKLDQAASACAQAGAPETALWLRSRAWRIATAAGLDSAPAPGAPAPAADPEAVLACPPPLAFGLDGWEVQLRGEEKEHGPWHGNAASLVLGFAPEETPSTGQVRALPRRPVFVRSPQPLRGRYSFRAEVVPLTPYVEGELIAGFRGGNRYVRILFSFGSEGYALGISPVEEIREVHVSFTDLRERDGALWGGAREFRIPLPKPRGTDFTAAVELLVDGPDASFFFDGQLVGVLHTANNMPIEGYAGFAVSAGAVRFQDPLLQQHAGWRGGPRCPCHEPPAPWNPAVASDWSWETMIGRAAEGLEPGPQGTLVQYVPEDPVYDGMSAAELAEMVRYEVEAVGDPLPEIPAQFQPAWAVALPQVLYGALPAEVRQAAAARHVRVLSHPPHPGYQLWLERTRANVVAPGHELMGRPDSLLIFVDADGVIRAVDSGEDVARWMRVLRGF